MLELTIQSTSGFRRIQENRRARAPAPATKQGHGMNSATLFNMALTPAGQQSGGESKGAQHTFWMPQVGQPLDLPHCLFLRSVGTVCQWQCPASCAVLQLPFASSERGSLVKVHEEGWCVGEHGICLVCAGHDLHEGHTEIIASLASTQRVQFDKGREGTIAVCDSGTVRG
jgi:hypothetical protein